MPASGLGNVLALCVSEATHDEELGCAAQALLRSSPDGPVRALGCDARDGVVTLSGVVPSFYLKRMAQVLLFRLHGLRGVRNVLEVREGT
jgi:hypothetical protein